VQKVGGTDPSGHPDKPYWEAFRVEPGGRGATVEDQSVGGGIGSTATFSARFYEGLSLPDTFFPGEVIAAGGLPSTYINPHLSTDHASNVVNGERDYDPSKN
jgi:hypothetical protein